jgi:hypothetical protein
LEWIEPLKEWLEEETAQWAGLFQMKETPAPRLVSDAETDVRAVDDELRRLTTMRDRWDEVLDHVAMLFRMLRGWEILGFASFGHYSDERLGMGERTIEQRASLENRLYRLPSLRRAMRERKLSYEKARLIARYADDDSVGAWVGRAERMTCIDLRRKLQAKEEAQMCARGELGAWVPLRVRGLVALAFRAARTAAGCRLSPGECLVRIAEHFIEVWGPALQERPTPAKQVRDRDGGFCGAPGCSRAGGHGHHIEFRSAGGSDDPSNLVSVCAAHHLHGVHMGWVRVTGKAPDGLRWELGVRPGLPPLEVFVSTHDGLARVEQPGTG